MDIEISFANGVPYIVAERDNEHWTVWVYKGDSFCLSDEQMAKEFSGYLENPLVHKFILRLEDTILCGEKQEHDWLIAAVDLTAVKVHSCSILTTVLSAICMLAIGGDTVDHADVYYLLAEQAISSWNGIRPIP